jgi:putative DNA primase/helicase
MSDYTLVPDDRAQHPADPEALARLGAVVTASGYYLPADLHAVAGEVAERLLFDDMGRADLFALLNVSGVSWDPSIGRFRLWNGSAWEEDPSKDHLGAHARIETTVNLLLDVLDSRCDPADGDSEDAAKHKKDVRKALYYLRSREKRQTILQDAKHRVARPESEYDRNPEELNTPAGLLNLRTGELAAHHPGMLVTRATAVPFDPGARSEAFEELLHSAMPDEGIRAFVQDAFGASLTGLAAMRAVFVLHGPTGTRKSTLLQVLKAAMGSYADTLPETAIAQATADRAINEGLAKLVGRRAGFADELPEGFRPNLAVLKRLTGSDTFDLEQKYKPSRPVRTTAKLWVGTNHPFVIAVDDDAAWGRIYAVPMEQSLPPERQDKQYAARLVADPQVLAAALAWGVEGARRVLGREGRLDPPAAVQSRREELRQDANPLSELVEAGWLVLDASAAAAGRDVEEAAEEYARRRGRGRGWVPRARKLGAMLQKLGAERDTSRSIRGRDGLPATGWRGVRVDLDAAFGAGAERAARAAAAKVDQEPL